MFHCEAVVEAEIFLIRAQNPANAAFTYAIGYRLLTPQPFLAETVKRLKY